MAIVDTFVAARRKALSATYLQMVRWSPRYRSPVRAFLRRLHLEKLVLASSMARRLLLTKDEPRYRVIFTSRPQPVNTASDLELHMLISERDMLRGMWALKSFFHFSNLHARLVLHNDGSLSTRSLQTLRTHFPGSAIPPEGAFDATLDGYPLCQFFRGKHVISYKLLHVLLAAEAEYLIVMDTDVLWFGESNQILDCVRTRKPFHQPSGGHEAYARNRNFMEEHCGLKPARSVNTGIIGYPRAECLDFDFIEDALDRMINIPPELVPASRGYPVTEPGKEQSLDPVDSVNWWVMEQTLYALLFGRSKHVVQLSLRPENGNKAHPFINQPIKNQPITKDTALQHFISEIAWNAQFPVGVEHLLRNGFLREWEARA